MSKPAMTLAVNNTERNKKRVSANQPEERTYKNFVNFWKQDFTSKIQIQLNSRKAVFTLYDAIKQSEGRRSKLDSVMIEYINYINSNPLNDNDYFKYFNSYINGKRLDEKYFRHDLNELHRYYKKYDSKTNKEKQKYNKFSVPVWERYVLFMMLKFNDVYEDVNGFYLDKVFNVKTVDNRQYNPLTNVERALRGMLPASLKLTEYDISRANPTFIDIELGIDRKEDIYSKFNKFKFNTLINLHKGNDGVTIEGVRKQLAPLYNGKVNDVITEKRFNNQGQMTYDLTKHEKQYIERFITANDVSTYVRLHDAVFVKQSENITQTEFGKVKFNETPLTPPAVINDNILFYSFDKKKNVSTSPVSYKKFLEQENFIRVTEPNNDSITIFKDSNNVVKPFNYKTDTVSFLKSKINEFDTTAIENKIAKDNNRDLKDSFCLIDAKPLIYYRDAKDGFGIPFKNGFCRFNKDRTDIEIIPYKDVNGFFPEHNTQRRVLKPKVDGAVEMSEFERFLTMVAVSKDPLNDTLTDAENDTVTAFFCMYGYLCHTYKDPSFNPSIIFSDNGANDFSRNGGRGKSLVAKAISEIQKTMIKGGSEFDGGYRHRFADLDPSVKVYVIDDVPARFKYDDLYTNILGGISCELKGLTAKTIEFEDAPKFVVTTNWAVMYDKDANSTNRRFLEFKFSDFFNLQRTPQKIFNHNFFSDWNENEWNRFYNFSFNCVNMFLELGLTAPVYDKNADNYKAYFNNDSVEEEFERVFSIVRNYSDGFQVNDFLNVYNEPSNPMRFEKYFHKNNTKKMIDTYLRFHNIDPNYVVREKKWRCEPK